MWKSIPVMQPTFSFSALYFYRAIRMSRYRDSGSSDCKLYVGDLGKMLCNFIYIFIFILVACILSL